MKYRTIKIIVLFLFSQFFIHSAKGEVNPEYLPESSEYYYSKYYEETVSTGENSNGKLRELKEYLNECGNSCNKQKLDSLLSFTPAENLYARHMDNLVFKIMDTNAAFYNKFTELINSLEEEIVLPYHSLLSHPKDKVTHHLKTRKNELKYIKANEVMEFYPPHLIRIRSELCFTHLFDIKLINKRKRPLILEEIIFESKMLTYSYQPVKLGLGEQKSIRLELFSKVRGVHSIRALFVFNNHLSIMYLIEIAIFENHFDIRPVFLKQLIPDEKAQHGLHSKNTQTKAIIFESAYKTNPNMKLLRGILEFKNNQSITCHPFGKAEYIATVEYTPKANETVESSVYLRSTDNQILRIPYIFQSMECNDEVFVLPNFIDFGVVSTLGLPHRVPIHIFAKEDEEKPFFISVNTEDPNILSDLTPKRPRQRLNNQNGKWTRRVIGSLTYYNPIPGLYKGKIIIQVKYEQTNIYHANCQTSNIHHFEIKYTAEVVENALKYTARAATLEYNKLMKEPQYRRNINFSHTFENTSLLPINWVANDQSILTYSENPSSRSILKQGDEFKLDYEIDKNWLNRGILPLKIYLTMDLGVKYMYLPLLIYDENSLLCMHRSLEFGMTFDKCSKYNVLNLGSYAPHYTKSVMLSIWNIMPLRLNLGLINITNDREPENKGEIEVYKKDIRSLTTGERMSVSKRYMNKIRRIRENVLPPESITEYIIQLSPNMNISENNEGEEHKYAQLGIESESRTTSIQCRYSVHSGTIRPISYRLNQELGRMKAEFPGKEVFQPIFLNSTFNTTVRVSNVISSNPQVKIHILNTRIGALGIEQIGNIVFNPYELYKKSQFTWGITYRNYTEYKRYEELRNNIYMKENLEAEISIYTDIGYNFNITFHGIIKYLEGILSEDNTLDFGQIIYGSSIRKQIKLHNPSSFPIQLEFYLSNISLEDIEEHQEENNMKHISDKSSELEFNTYLSQVTNMTNSQIPTEPVIQPLNFDSLIRIFSHYKPEINKIENRNQSFFLENSIIQQTHILPPSSNISINGIIFYPHLLGSHESFLIIKNNLTYLHQIKLTGQGVKPRILNNNGEMNINLTIELNRSRKIENSVITELFTVRNVDNIDLKIIRIGIGGLECKGYGFSINNCEEFILNRGGEHILNISYELDYIDCEKYVPLTFYPEGGSGIRMHLSFISDCKDYKIIASEQRRVQKISILKIIMSGILTVTVLGYLVLEIILHYQEQSQRHNLLWKHERCQQMVGKRNISFEIRKLESEALHLEEATQILLLKEIKGKELGNSQEEIKDRGDAGESKSEYKNELTWGIVRETVKENTISVISVVTEEKSDSKLDSMVTNIIPTITENKGLLSVEEESVDKEGGRKGNSGSEKVEREEKILSTPISHSKNRQKYKYRKTREEGTGTPSPLNTIESPSSTPIVKHLEESGNIGRDMPKNRAGKRKYKLYNEDRRYKRKGSGVESHEGRSHEGTPHSNRRGRYVKYIRKDYTGDDGSISKVGGNMGQGVGEQEVMGERVDGGYIENVGGSSLSVIGGTGDTGDIIMDTGDIIMETGDIIMDTGDIIMDTGDIIMDTGDIIMERKAPTTTIHNVLDAVNAQPTSNTNISLISTILPQPPLPLPLVPEPAPSASTTHPLPNIYSPAKSIKPFLSTTNSYQHKLRLLELSMAEEMNDYGVAYKPHLLDEDEDSDDSLHEYGGHFSHIQLLSKKDK